MKKGYDVGHILFVPTACAYKINDELIESSLPCGGQIFLKKDYPLLMEKIGSAWDNPENPEEFITPKDKPAVFRVLFKPL